MESRSIFLHLRPLNWGDAVRKVTRLLNSEMRLRPIRITRLIAKKSPSIC
jgi:hypothetical protein